MALDVGDQLLDDARARLAELQQIVDAVATGERPRRTEPAQVAPRKTAGLLEETLQLIARAQRGVPSETSSDRKVFEIASTSDPGKVYRVEVVAGINLPMLIKLASVRDEAKLADAVVQAQDAGRKYINVASQILGD